MLVGFRIGERRDQGEALAKSRSLFLTIIFLLVRWPESTRSLDGPPHPSLDLGGLFRFHRLIHQKPFFSRLTFFHPTLTRLFHRKLWANLIRPQFIVTKQRSPKKPSHRHEV
jgi:hypothetical protein